MQQESSNLGEDLKKTGSLMSDGLVLCWVKMKVWFSQIQSWFFIISSISL